MYVCVVFKWERKYSIFIAFTFLNTHKYICMYLFNIMYIYLYTFIYINKYT